MSDEKTKAAQDKAQGAYNPPIGRQETYTPPKNTEETIQETLQQSVALVAAPFVIAAAIVDYVVGTNMTGVNDDINEKQREYNDAWDRAPRTPR